MLILLFLFLFFCFQMETLNFQNFPMWKGFFFFFFLFQLTVFTGVEYFVVFLLLLFLVIEPVHSERNQLVWFKPYMYFNVLKQ